MCVNEHLYLLNITDSQKYALCTHKPEPLDLLFVKCIIVKIVWSSLELWRYDSVKSSKIVKFSLSNIILDSLHKDIGLDMTVLRVKKYIIYNF